MKDVEKLLEEALVASRERKEVMDKKLSDKILKPVKLNSFPDLKEYKVCTGVSLESVNLRKPACMFGDRSPHNLISDEDSLLRRKEAIDEKAREYIKDCEAVYESNLELIAHNEAVRERVILFMEEIGIKSVLRGHTKSSRSGKIRHKEVKSGYLLDLEKNVKVFQNAVPKFENLTSGVKVEYDRILSDIKKKKAKRDMELREREEAYSIAFLRAKYTPDDRNSSTSEILYAILDKDKYLRLGYHLEANQYDWSDGYTYAEEGIEGFDVDLNNEDDISIINEIFEILSVSDEFKDGRVFRDCNWNYNTLYGKVEDKQLLEDLQVLKRYDIDSYVEFMKWPKATAI